MSKNASQFIHDLISNKSLRDEVRKLSSPDAVIQAAKQYGYDFDANDLRQAYGDWYKARTGSATPISAEDLKDLTGASPGGGHDYYDEHRSYYADYAESDGTTAVKHHPYSD